MMSEPNHRILLVDDNPAIHDDFRKILAGGETDAALDAAEAILFEETTPKTLATTFEIESALQGREALDKVVRSLAVGRPYAMAFVDVRMPPGWDGIETIEHLWRVDPSLQVVVCTAYSDYSWEKMSARLGVSDRLVILKKPFDNIEVLQLAHALTNKWTVTQQANLRLEVLDKMVNDRTRELQAANAELRRSEERFSKAFRASPVALAIQTFDEDAFVDVNDAFVQMTGFSRAQLIGRTPLELRFCLEYETRIRQALRDNVPIINVEAQISTREGELRQTLISMERITLGDEPHVLLLVQDVTERLRLESQLRQAQKMEAIGQLAAGVAHDFNNLLTIIEGHASLQLAAPGAGTDVTESFEQIEKAAERAAELTRQLLAFSRRQIMRPRVLGVNAVVRDLLAMLTRLMGAQIELKCDLDATLPMVFADQTSVEQVIMNLTLNARDAMTEGGIITIRTEAVTIAPEYASRHGEAIAGQFVCLSVTDTGSGMDDATRGRIFEPFFTTKEVNKGTGMGLATVYGIVKQHEGWLDVHSAPGEGSTFFIYLPVTDKAHEVTESAAPTTLNSGGGRTILIVEDDGAVRSLVKEILVGDGYRVLEAEDAEHALSVWQRHRAEIELLLTDMVMPGANGLELAEMLLADRPELKVIYTSGYSSELFASDVELAEGINYLPKPYLSSKLVSILHRAFDRPALAA